MATYSSSSTSLLPTKLVLGFQRSTTGSEIPAISISSIRAKAAPPLTTHLCFRFVNGKSLKMKQRMPILFATPSEGDIVKEKAAEGSETSDAQGPPILTILAGVAVFFFIAWIAWIIGSVVISLIVTVSPK